MVQHIVIDRLTALSMNNQLYSREDKQLAWCCVEGSSALLYMVLENQVPFYHRSFSLYNLYNALLDQSAKKKKNHVLCSELPITKLSLLEQHPNKTVAYPSGS